MRHNNANPDDDVGLELDPLFEEEETGFATCQDPESKIQELNREIRELREENENELDDHRRELADANDLRSGPDVLENFDDDTRLPPQRVRRRVHRPQAQGICKVRKEPIADLVERRPRVRLHDEPRVPRVGKNEVEPEERAVNPLERNLRDVELDNGEARQAEIEQDIDTNTDVNGE
ncbi:protein GrpE-like [Microplitis demolitor]|uniref:protein GrpE-like n=1 Tax=Microplitis demolitor TaxID=69319 RepID=UPI00235B6FB7|nr:protein GrpE-like [Microplitis demolitor]